LAVAVCDENHTEKQAQRLSLPRPQNRSCTQTQRFFSISAQFFGVVIGPKCCSAISIFSPYKFFPSTFLVPKMLKENVTKTKKCDFIL